MGNIFILNGSPRASKSNSKQYAEIFSKNYLQETIYKAISKTNQVQLCRELSHYSDVLFVFPLYADALPVGLLHFLKTLETNLPEHKPTVSILINCGFLEPEQNEVAVKIIHLFCRRNGFPIGSTLMLGSGEAILKSPFKYIAIRNIRKLAKCIASGNHQTIQATMPLPKFLFRLAANKYWTKYGQKFGITKKQMQTMETEG